MGIHPLHRRPGAAAAGSCSALTVLVVAFRNGQDNSLSADQVSVKPDAREQDGEIFARRHGYLYAECDSRTGQGVKDAITRVAEDAHAVA